MVAIIRSAWCSSTTWNGNRTDTWPAAWQRVPLESTQTNKRRHRGRRRPGRWLCRGMGSPRCEGFRAARSALREEEGLRRAFSGNATAGHCASVCVARQRVRTCVRACVCAFACCWGRVGGRGCFLPQTVRSDDRHRVLRIELHSRALYWRARTKTRARAQRRRTFLTSTSGLCMRPTYTAQSQGRPQRNESGPLAQSNEQNKPFRNAFAIRNGDLSFTVAEP
jgi:hypothetical protein